MAFPEISHEAGPTFDSNRAVISKVAASPSTLDVPDILKKIAICESNDKHFNEKGEVLTGKYDPRDIGRYQINKGVWGQEAEKLGFNIYSEEGNEAFAMYLFGKQGTKPWVKSKFCWSKESAGW